ncbi:putative 11-beta-hydroxysteroid dehydrogenase [Helianthus annuus]|nr:putative 11-beta-hydroxysteroid dehydrogenase [Helianthus annuus]KAJ0833763.1 putative 11-beta-hydroxysteroid dehydrogenase [Helianthus annuus]
MLNQASKAALSQFYETMRVEFGSDVKITIVTPGFIESEMTQGKFLSHEGKMVVDRVARDVEETATAIVKQVLRGERYVTEPAWMKMTYVWQVLWPEAVEWVNRLMCMTTVGGESRHDTFGKRILDMVGGRSILYPTSIRSPEMQPIKSN